PGAGGTGDTGARCARVTTGACGPGGTAAASPGGARTMGAFAWGVMGAQTRYTNKPFYSSGLVTGILTWRVRLGDPTEPGVARTGGTGAGGNGAGGAGAGGTGASGAGAGDAGAVDPGAGACPLPAPSPYTEQSGGLTERREPASRPVSLVRNARRVPRLGPPPILGTQAMALRPSSVPLRVPLLPPFESSFPVDPDPESDLVRAASPTVSPLLATIVTDPTFESTAASALVAELLDFEVLQRFGFQFSSPQPTPLSTSHSLSAPPSDECVEPSVPYLELVGCLITLGMGLVLGGRGLVVLTGHADASWVNDSATQRLSLGYTFSLGSGFVSWRSTCSSSVLSSSCEAEIYAGAMAAQELCWLTYLLTELGEQPRSPPFLYVDNKAMIALCQEHRLEHRTKHIALRYFLARELQLHGQLCLAYVATRANTADIFTKALPPGDHQLFSTVLGIVPTLPHLLTA
ncbi:unnamed protein product, partial [Closterium sp. NIES-54]